MALSIEWTDEARADVRALDRSTAMQIFDGVYRYAVTGLGDVKALKGSHAGKLRLRVGGCRVFLSFSTRTERSSASSLSGIAPRPIADA